MKKMIRLWFKKILGEQSPPILDKIAAISSIAGLAITIITLLREIILTEYKNFSLMLCTWWKGHATFISIVWLVVISAVLINMIIKYRSSAIIKMNASAFGLSRIMNKTLEFIESLGEFALETEDDNCEACQHIQKLQRKLLYTRFIQYTISFLDELVEIMSSYVSYEVSACVKLVVDCVEKDNGGDDQLMKKQIVTLTRDSRSDAGRSKSSVSEPVPLERNSDFYDIVNGSKEESEPYFYVTNLKEYSKMIDKISNGQHKYLNSTPNWWDYYIGTAVVPIGSIASKKDVKDYTVWGFLCIDSLNERAFTLRQRDINIKLLQGFASIYSMAVKEYNLKLKKFMKTGGADNV